MADTFTFELVSPEQLLLSVPVTQVTVPGSEGYMTIMA
ncbi:MAG: F0F1 ATP synthase subunit epsilon, partial [Pseudomonadota bacterium]